MRTFKLSKVLVNGIYASNIWRRIDSIRYIDPGLAVALQSLFKIGASTRAPNDRSRDAV